MSGQQTVAVLGAGGTMGYPMAVNLARAGFPVRAWNRSRDKAEPLTQDGVQVFGTPKQAADGAGVILTMLADTDAVLAAVDGPDGAFAALPPAAGPGGPEDGPIWLQMSTIGEEGTERCADLAGRRDVTLIDAPVLGTKQPADRREAGGPGLRARHDQKPGAADLRRGRAEDDVGRARPARAPGSSSWPTTGC